MKTPPPLPAGLSASTFLRDYWQKKPLLIRQAFPHLPPLLDPQQLFELACDPDAQARLITQQRGQWEMDNGPFAPQDFSRSRKTPWTVLVQGVNHYLPQAAELLQHFNFIPHSRLDDLMVSYAPKGGGVGPHFDSYDVFLLQGTGHRRWQISAQRDRTLVDGAPLKILCNFKPAQEWVLAPGDMLYLPPHYAHNGVAEDDCMTYSIGFRAPSYQELAGQFLVHLQDNLCMEGMYADPQLKTQRHPSEISTAMLQQVGEAIHKIRWSQRDITDFLGRYLSEPKPHIFFEPPAPALSRARFLQAARARGIALDLQTQMLCCSGTIFMNGEAHAVDAASYRVLREFADARHLNTTDELPQPALDLLYHWYLDGYIALGKK